MKKSILLIIALIGFAGYGQAEFDAGIQITGGQPTVTSVNFLTTTEVSGVQGKIDPVLLPLPTATINAINVQDATVVHKIGNESIQDKKDFTLNSLTEAEAAVTIKRQYPGVATNKVSVLNLVNEGELAGGTDYQNEVTMFLKAGTSSNHRRYIGFKNYDDTTSWLTGANAGNSWILYDGISGLHRYWNMTTADGGHTYINSAGTGRIYLNQFNDGGTGNGTGGVYIGNGGTSPTTQWYVDNEGRMTSPANTTANLRYWQTIGGVFTDNTSSTQGGLYSSTFSSPASNGTGNVTGGTLRAVHNTAFNAASVTGVFGVGRTENTGIVTIVAGADFSAQNAGTATITGLYGARFGLSAGTGSTTTNGYGFYVSAPSGSGTITGYRGGRILDYTASSFTYGLELGINSGANKYAIYSSGTGKSYHNGPFLVGSSTDNGIDKLQITGTVSGSVDATLSNQFVRKGQLDLKADLASALLTTGDQSFTGAKSAVNTGTFGAVNGLNLQNAGTADSRSINLLNSNTGIGMFISNSSSGVGSYDTNSSSGVLKIFESATGSTGDLTRWTKNLITTAKVDQNGEFTAQKYNLNTGSNASVGNAVLVAGTVTVTTTAGTASSVIMLTRKTAGGVVGDLTYIPNAGGFTINSDSVADTSTVSYLIIN